MLNRRKFVTGAAALTAGSAVLSKMKLVAANTPVPESPTESPANQKSFTPGEPGRDYTPVITPNNISLPWKVVRGVKVYHLIAEPVRHEIAPGLVVDCWGYNGRVHGPT